MIQNGLLEQACYIPSPHHDLRSENTSINLLVIHCASLPEGEYDNDNIEQLFTGQMSKVQQLELKLPGAGDLKVSAHLYITRAGKLIQFVNFNQRAWHAGSSSFQGIENCNDFSIGIELQGTVQDSFTDAQYTALIGITKNILVAYPKITKQRIVGHVDIAPGRKTDPGEKFDWNFYLGSI